MDSTGLVALVQGQRMEIRTVDPSMLPYKIPAPQAHSRCDLAAANRLDDSSTGSGRCWATPSQEIRQVWRNNQHRRTVRTSSWFPWSSKLTSIRLQTQHDHPNGPLRRLSRPRPIRDLSLHQFPLTPLHTPNNQHSQTPHLDGVRSARDQSVLEPYCRPSASAHRICGLVVRFSQGSSSARELTRFSLTSLASFIYALHISYRHYRDRTTFEYSRNGAKAVNWIALRAILQRQKDPDYVEPVPTTPGANSTCSPESNDLDAPGNDSDEFVPSGAISQFSPLSNDLDAPGNDSDDFVPSGAISQSRPQSDDPDAPDNESDVFISASVFDNSDEIV